jgi:phage shock protein PspC (stress-responsive transcriptional regulator)
MQRVISINLNGNAYQIEESGFAALTTYLEGAERQLKDNPDCLEIVADLEQAIADKCRRFLGPHKTVVAASEVDQIIKDMGPVGGSDAKSDGHADGDAAGGGSSATADHGGSSGAPRRLYLIREGSMIAGVCNGIAAYIHVDVTIIRIIVIALTLLSKGGFILIYMVLAFVIPPADTSEERAAAHGMPFNAQEVIDRAKDHYSRFKDQNNWRQAWRADRQKFRQEWRQGRQQWKEEWRQQKRQWREQWYGYSATALPPLGYGARVLAGIMVPLLSIVSAICFWIWIYALVSLSTSRQVFGLALPPDIPLWIGLVALVFAYQFVAWPLHAARRGSYWALGGRHRDVAALEGIMSIGFAILILAMAYRYLPEAREVMRAIPEVVRSVVDTLKN